MSTTHHTAGSSTSNFDAIFDAALHEYETLTGKSLASHPFYERLDTCHSPEDVLNVFQDQAQDFRKFYKREEKLMAWLNPIINILFTISATLAEGVGLVSRRLTHFVQSSSNVWFSAILSRESNLHRYRCSSRSKSLPRRLALRLYSILPQVMHIVTNHLKVVNLFERIHLFLGRLKVYTGVPLTNELREVLGNIMAELLTILALSTKEMRDGKISESI